MTEAADLLQAAMAQHQSGRLHEAEHAYRQVLALDADDPNAAHLLGLVLCALGRTEAGLDSIARALTLAPSFAAAWYNHANTLYTLGRLAEALDSYDRALALQPDFAPAHHNRARTLLALDRAEDALAACEAGMALTPQESGLATLHGDALQELGRFAEALDSYDRALEARPGDPAALTNRGNAMLALGESEAALTQYAAALRSDPGHADAHYNQARALQDRGDVPAALEGYTRALEARPDHAPARWNRSMCHLLLGDFAQGWPERWGWQAAPERPFPAPRWDGQAPLAGRTILLHVDQGLGDTLQFCRFAARVAALGAEVILEVQPSLVTLLESLVPRCAVFAQGAALPPFDLHCSLMDVPRALQISLDNLPAKTPYLHADPLRVVRWRERLAGLQGRRIGLVWGGSPRLDLKHRARFDLRRSMPLARMAALAGLPDTHFISLQKGPPAEQARTAPPALRLHDWTDELRDFADTAALVSALDLVISVDTSVAHLAGSLGVPVWLLNRQDTCWRWMLEREDSPWYPTLRQFRQHQGGDWDSVMLRVRAALSGFSPSPGR